MGDTKGRSSRLRSLRDSVKKITQQLSDGDAHMMHKNDEHAREVDKLRVQIQSMEEEIRRLYQSRYQLEQANKQNEKLVATLQEAKAQIEADGRVAWSNRQVGMGIQLERVAREVQDAIDAFVDRNA